MINVLLVDDSAVDRKLAAGLLEKDENVRVAQASSGEEALEAFDEHRPDIVVTDIQMPGINGLELLRELTDRAPEVPVILITAKGSEDVALIALKEGAASYVPKRRLAGDLRDTVQRIWLASLEQEEEEDARRRLVEVALKMRVEPDLSVLMSVARRLRDTLAEYWKCEQTLSLQICTALEEALSNAYYFGALEMDPRLRIDDYQQFIQRAYERSAEEKYRDRRIDVSARITPQRVSFTIADHGPGFDHAALPDPDLDAGLDAPVGRGVHLMRTFMDEVAYNEAGNEVTLVKNNRPGD